MTDVTTLVGVGTLLLVLMLLIFFASRILDWWNQKQTNRKRQRAHAGKVTCEEDQETCDKLATVLTHNGYFCPDHWEQNSKHYVQGGGWVTWHHTLAHTMKSS